MNFETIFTAVTFGEGRIEDIIIRFGGSILSTALDISTNNCTVCYTAPGPLINDINNALNSQEVVCESVTETRTL